MKLTDAERVILYRLHEVLALMQPEQAEHHQNKMEILDSGFHEQLYNFHLSKPFSKVDSEFAMDVLDMYRALHDSYRALPEKDNKLVDQSKVLYSGFDGNNESELKAFVRFLILKEGKWQE